MWLTLYGVSRGSDPASPVVLGRRGPAAPALITLATLPTSKQLPSQLNEHMLAFAVSTYPECTQVYSLSNLSLYVRANPCFSNTDRQSVSGIWNLYPEYENFR